MKEDEVPEENRLLYANPTLLNGIMALDTMKLNRYLKAAFTPILNLTVKHPVRKQVTTKKQPRVKTSLYNRS